MELESGLFELNGKAMEYDNLTLKVKQSLYDLEMEAYQRKVQLIDSAVLEHFLETEAKKQNKTVDEVAKTLVNLEKPSEEEVKAFYEQNKSRIPEPFEKIKGQITNYLAQQSVLEQQKQVLAKIKKDSGFKLLIEEPTPPVVSVNTKGFPSKGDKNGKIEIVEFADYQCPHCQTAAKAVKKVLEKHKKDVKVVFIDLPVNPSGISRKVAEAAACATEQGKYWDFHDMAFEQQSSLSAESPNKIAEALKLNMESFKTCLESGKTKELIATGENEARRLGLTGTPSFFVNGVKLHANGTLEESLIKAIETAKSQL